MLHDPQLVESIDVEPWTWRAHCLVILRFSTGKECWRPRLPCCSRVNYMRMIKERPDYIYSERKVDSFLFP